MADEQVVQAALAGLVEPLRRLKMNADWQKVVPEGVLAAQTAANWLMATQPAARGARLRSVFGSIGTEAGQAAPKPRYLPLKELALSQAVLFAEESAAVTSEGYAQHLKRFHAAAAAAGSNLEALLAVYQRYLWCVPGSEADVSLYDEARMVAALAACLAEGGEGAVLVGGDVSGVQEFIYTISSKGAAKMLRGRSFYLQLLTEAVLRFVLRRLGLPYSSVVYSGGGHFYLLAPPSARQALPAIQAEVGKILYRQHGTQLYLVLGQAYVPSSGFGAGKLQPYWQQMHNQLTIAKNRRYAELGDDLFDVFALPEYGGDPDNRCAVCGDDQRSVSAWAEDEQQAKICPLCRSFAESLGKDLPDTRFLALKFGEPKANRSMVKTALDILALFGMDVQFLMDAREQAECAADESVVIWALDDPKHGKWVQTTASTPHWLRYTANRVPKATFDELQKESGSGFERLGVLRMDVDNLGTIFKEGLGNAFSLARMAALSSQISLFFEGWLKRIVESDDLADHVYTVYAGGDDLFLLAPWDKVPALAQTIVDDFAKYTAHPGLHISGGMAFIDGKYPIYQAAEDAAEAEKLAKDSGKNAFAFLGKAWRWEDFRRLTGRKDDLVKLVKGETAGERGGPKSILQILQSLAQTEAETRKEKGQPVWGRWMWMGAYHLARLEDRYKNNAQLKGKIAALRKDLGMFEGIEDWGKAARWAQLETRNRSNSNRDKGGSQ